MEENNINEEEIKNESQSQEAQSEASAEQAQTKAQEQDGEAGETIDTDAPQVPTEEATDAPESEEEAKDKKITELEEKVKKMHNDYLLLYADFDNYKKRALKEKSELLQTSKKEVLINIVPLIDDMERAIGSIKEGHDTESIKEGVDLIYNKFVKFLADNNMKAIETEGQDFNTDYHEAVTMVPMGDDKKGKIIECIQKGYTLGEKVVRYAKVVVGQ